MHAAQPVNLPPPPPVHPYASAGERLAKTTAGVRKDRYGERKVQYEAIVSSTVLRARQVHSVAHCRSRKVWVKKRPYCVYRLPGNPISMPRTLAGVHS